MRKNLFKAICLLALALLAASCTNSGPGPILMTGGGIERPLSNKDIPRNISPKGLLEDIFDPPDDGTMEITWQKEPAAGSSSISLLSADNLPQSAIYAIVDFFDYAGQGLLDDGLCIRTGQMIFEFRLMTDFTATEEGTTIAVESYSSFVSSPLEIVQEGARAEYEVTGLEGISGSANTQIVISLEAGTSNLKVSLAAGMDIETAFETDKEISGEVNGTQVSAATTKEEAAKFFGEDRWLWLLTNNDRTDGYRVSYTPIDGSNYSVTIEFSNMPDRYGTIESGSIRYDISTTFLSLGDYNASLVNAASTVEPIVIRTYDTNERFTYEMENQAISGLVWTAIDGTTPTIFSNTMGSKGYPNIVRVNGETISIEEKPELTLSTYDIKGTGSEGNPYQIWTREQLYGVADLVNRGVLDTEGKYFKLMDDIDLHYAEWDGIGSIQDAFVHEPNSYAFFVLGIDYQNITEDEVYKIFRGHFDGNGKTIYNLAMNPGIFEESMYADGTSFNGFFGVIASGTTIKDLTIENVKMEVEGISGAFVGFIPNAEDDDANPRPVELTNLTLKGDIEIYGRNDIGGIVGRAMQKSELRMTNCDVIADAGSFITDNTPALGEFEYTTFMGGIIGTAYSRSGNGTTLDDCNVSNLKVDGAIECIGGVAGHFDTGTISGSDLKNVDVSINNRLNYTIDVQAAGAVAGSIINNVTLNGISFEDVTVTYPKHIEALRYFGVIGRHRSDDAAEIASKIISDGNYAEGNITGLTVINPQ